MSVKSLVFSLNSHISAYLLNLTLISIGRFIKIELLYLILSYIHNPIDI